jgi:hypothetical protein
VNPKDSVRSFLDDLSCLEVPQLVMKYQSRESDGDGILWHHELPHMMLSYGDPDPTTPPKTPSGYLCTASPIGFDLDGVHYYSLESFYHSLKWPESSPERLLCAKSNGDEAHEMSKRLHNTRFSHNGIPIKVGSSEHLLLLSRAVCAKVDQNDIVKELLKKSCWFKLRFSNLYLRAGTSPTPLGVVTPFALMLKRWKLWGPMPAERPVSPDEAFRILLWFDNEN